ncbi:hypothetical protein Droror1_Dr00003054 [Drosera rotundifolia]
MKRLRPHFGDGTDAPPAKTLRRTTNSPSPDETLQSILTTNSTLDSIEKLPDEILPLILAKVTTTKDLVRSSLVSRRWREIAVSTILCRPRLVLDGKSLFGSKCCGSRVKKKRYVEEEERFVRAVNQYLPFFWKLYLHYNKPTIVSSLVVEFCLGRSFSGDIDRWIDYVVQLLGI